MSFSRAFRLWERFFPGDQNPPNDVGKFVQPVFDAMSPRVGECQFQSQVQTVAACVAGSNSVTFAEPQPGRIFRSIRLAVLFSAPGATDIESRFLTGAPQVTDPWGAWTGLAALTIERKGYRLAAGAGQQNAFDMVELAVPDFVMRGQLLNAAVHGCAGGEGFEAHWFYIDAPAELLEL